MKNWTQPGNFLTVAAPSPVSSGAGLLAGSIFGVAVTSAEAEAPVEIAVTGCFKLPKATGTAWSVGDPVYWDSSNGQATHESEGNTLVGVAIRAADTADEEGEVRLNGAFGMNGGGEPATE